MRQGRSAIEVLQNLEDAFAPSQPSKEMLAASEASMELMEDAKRRLGRDAFGQDAEIARLWYLLGQSELADVYQNRLNESPRSTVSSALQEETRMDSVCHKARRVSSKTSLSSERAAVPGPQ